MNPGEPSTIAADEADTLVVTKPLPLSEIVEDELLLAMPMIPGHASGECPAGAAKTASRARETNLFTVLGVLKRE